MSLASKGYDGWLQRMPEEIDDRLTCSWCGGPMDRNNHRGRIYWRCEECGTEVDEEPQDQPEDEAE